MSTVVGGFIVPHAPVIAIAPDSAPEPQRTAVFAAFDETARRFAELEPTAVVIIGTDHYVMFGPDCLPTMLIGIGDVEGPLERLPAIPRGPISSSPDLAAHVHRFTTRLKFDWAIAKSITIDHSVAVPHHYVVKPSGAVPLTPIYLACGVAPYVGLARAAELGTAIGAAIAAHPGNERVVVIGSGGISHSVGTARMGDVNEDFDRRILELLERGALQELSSFSDEELESEGGNGALEVRTFACALAAVGGKAETIAYVAVREWLTGMGFAQIRPA